MERKATGSCVRDSTYIDWMHMLLPHDLLPVGNSRKDVGGKDRVVLGTHEAQSTDAGRSAAD